MLDLNNCFTYAYSAGTEADFFQTVTGDAASTNYIDLDVANLNIAAGRPIYLIVKVGTAFATGDAATGMDIKLETDTDSGFATALKDVQTWNFLLATMAAGTVLINQALPVQKYQQYMRLYFNAIGGTFSAGTICAYLSDGPEAPESQIDLVDVA